MPGRSDSPGRALPLALRSCVRRGSSGRAWKHPHVTLGASADQITRRRTMLTHPVSNEVRYGLRVIRSFADRYTERVWNRRRTALPPEVQRRAWNKLAMLNQAAGLEDLRVPPGNRLEQLRGNRAGQYSIRINRQWRICFTWTEAGPGDVQIVDYH